MNHSPKIDGFAQKIQTSFDAQTMMTTFGAGLLDIQPGQCTISAPILPGARQQHDYAHAALTFALGDSAAGYAALSLMGEQDEVVTVEMKINLITPAKGQRLIARGDVVKSGRRVIVVKAEVLAEDGDQVTAVALLQGTLIPV